MPLLLLAASALFYMALLLFGFLHGFQHLHLVLLSFQYVILLPILLWGVRSLGSSNVSEGVPRINLWIVLVAFAVVAIPLSRFSAQGLLNPDESGYSFQARLYRSGRIMADPLVGATSDVRQTPAELFYANHVLLPTGWFPKFPPGWPMVLSLGYRISARWLLNPAFGLLQLIAIAGIGKKLFSLETGAAAAFLAVLSPFYVVNSIGMMSHALCALLAVTACLALFSAMATGSLWYYTAMFACLAATLQVRPYTGFVLTLVLTLSALWVNRDNRTVLVRVFAIGAVFGALALAGVLTYNHTYTGRWLVSPYALAAGGNTPPELSFNPFTIWNGIRQYAPQTTEESLIGVFPFAYLLGGYALFQEKQRRREVWILASIYFALVIAYLAHPDGSGVFFGERFHFEGFFAVLLLAARGLQVLIQRWHLPRHAVAWTLIVFAAMQIAQQAVTAATVAHRGEPYRRVREAIATSDATGLVLLHDSPGFVAKHFNLNDADWRNASRIYLVDAEPNRRDTWACKFRVSSWTAVTYDPRAHNAVIKTGKADCGP